MEYDDEEKALSFVVQSTGTKTNQSNLTTTGEEDD